MKTREIIYEPTEQENEFIGYFEDLGDDLPIYLIFLGCIDNKWHAIYHNSRRLIHSTNTLGE
jgi:hypothetical protein